MEKIKIEVLTEKEVLIPYSADVFVKVNPIIKISEQEMLKERYITALFTKDGSWDEQLASFMFRREIISSKTNIDIDGMNLDDLDNLIWGDFYKKISSSIINYEEVEKSIHLSASNLIKRIEIESGFGYLVNGLIEKFKPLIDEISNIKPEELDKMKNSLSELLEKTKEEPIASIFNDMNKK